MKLSHLRVLGRGGMRARSAGPTAVPEALAALSTADRSIVDRSLPYTMTGVPRLQALIDAVRFLESRRIPGAFAECGVWRGGSVLAMIATLQQMGAQPREIWLYDTFEGMTEPTERDVSDFAPPALSTWRAAKSAGVRPWSEMFEPEVFNEAEVRNTLSASGYAMEHVHLVRGPVERTLPAGAPDQPLALLRLDTDWYESTRHELEHLYPRLQTGGVLIIDDYGHFEGARQAVDEYFRSHPPLLLNRIDYTGRIAVKA